LTVRGATQAESAADKIARRGKFSPAFADIDRLFQDFATENHVPGAAWGIVIRAGTERTDVPDERFAADYHPPSALAFGRVS